MFPTGTWVHTYVQVKWQYSKNIFFIILVRYHLDFVSTGLCFVGTPPHSALILIGLLPRVPRAARFNKITAACSLATTDLRIYGTYVRISINKKSPFCDAELWLFFSMTKINGNICHYDTKLYGTVPAINLFSHYF